MPLNPQVLEKLLGIRFDQVDTAQVGALGVEIDCDDGTRRKYIKASGTIAQFDALTFTGTQHNWKSTDAVNQGVAGICPVAGVATTNFFWAIVGGPAVVKAATVVALTQLVSTATSGTLDDTVAAAANALGAAGGKGVTAITADGTPTAGQARVYLS